MNQTLFFFFRTVFVSDNLQNFLMWWGTCIFKVRVKFSDMVLLLCEFNCEVRFIFFTWYYW